MASISTSTPLTGRSSPMNTRSVALLRAYDRREFGARHAVVHDAHQAFRIADLAAEDFLAVGAFEQEQVAAQHQQALGRQIELPGQRVVAEQQAAAVRRIGAHGAVAAEGKPRIGAALGAVAVHDVGLGLRRRGA